MLKLLPRRVSLIRIYNMYEYCDISYEYVPCFRNLQIKSVIPFDIAAYDWESEEYSCYGTYTMQRQDIPNGTLVLLHVTVYCSCDSLRSKTRLNNANNLIRAMKYRKQP